MSSCFEHTFKCRFREFNWINAGDNEPIIVTTNVTKLKILKYIVKILKYMVKILKYMVKILKYIVKILKYMVKILKYIVKILKYDQTSTLISVKLIYAINHTSLYILSKITIIALKFLLCFNINITSLCILYLNLVLILNFLPRKINTQIKCYAISQSRCLLVEEIICYYIVPLLLLTLMLWSITSSAKLLSKSVFRGYILD